MRNISSPLSGLVSPFGRLSGINPASFFLNGETGIWYEIEDVDTLWRDVAGTLSVVHDDFVARADDKSGLGYNATQANVLKRPQYKTNGTLHWLVFGTDKWLETDVIDFGDTDEMVVIAGVEKTSDAALGVIAELSATTASNDGSFALTAPVGASASYGFQSKGTLLTSTSAIGFTSPTSNVVTGIADISNNSNTLKVDGVIVDTDTGDQGLGNFGSYKLYIGARGGVSDFFSGNLYSLIVRNVLATKPSAAPVNTNAPAITGTLASGDTLTTTDGTWTGWPVPTLTRKWYDDDVEIVGETGSTFVSTDTQIGGNITSKVTATNASGPVVETSPAVGPIVAGSSSAMEADTSGLHWYRMENATVVSTEVTAITDNKGSADLAKVGSLTGPADGTDHMVFAGGLDGLRSTADGAIRTAIVTGGDNIVCFAVLEFDETDVALTIANNFVCTENLSDSSWENTGFGISWTGATATIAVSSRSAVNATYKAGAISQSTKILVRWHLEPATLLTGYEDGATTGNTASAIGAYSLPAHPISLGGKITDAGVMNNPFCGKLYEFYCTTDDSTLNMDAIEAELATKFSITL